MEIMENIYGEHRRSCSKTLSIAGYVIEHPHKHRHL
jgi:hypothetical protein